MSIVNYFFIFVIAGLVGFIGLNVFKRLDILDKPFKYKDVPPRDPVPSIQGFPMLIGVLITIFLFFPNYFLDSNLRGFFLGAFILGAVSLIDNFVNISPKIRLLLQIIAGAIAFCFSGVGFNEFVLPGGIGVLHFHYIVGLILTIIWFVGFINAVNWFDSINGVATGVSSIGFLTIFILINFVVLPAHDVISVDKLYILNMTSNLSWIMLCFSVVYSFIEFKPLGMVRDIGTVFLGFCLAYLSLMGGAKIGTIIVVLSLVILDSVWVIVNRLFVLKRNPMKGDFSHINHRLLSLGLSRTESRVFIWCWSFFFMVLMILQGTNRTGKIIIFLMMSLIFFGLNIYLFWIKKIPMEFQPDYTKEKEEFERKKKMQKK